MAHINITTECNEFCNQHKLHSELISCLKAANAIFSNIISVTAELSCFESACFESGVTEHIVIRVNAKLSQDYGMIQYDEYASWLVDTIPPNKISMFVLCLHRI